MVASAVELSLEQPRRTSSRLFNPQPCRIDHKLAFMTRDYRTKLLHAVVGDVASKEEIDIGLIAPLLILWAAAMSLFAQQWKSHSEEWVGEVSFCITI